jgi:5-methyltetrahydrofolate--homocysteine methyltransferase
MHPTLKSLLASPPVLTDGAWGTLLQAVGLKAGESPDAWNLARPDAVRAVATAYVEAGSMIILTNTFRANRLALASEGLSEKVREINAAGVRISREAAEGHARVFASVGPSGRMLLDGQTSEQDLAEAFAEQTEALAQAGAEGIVIETMSDVGEAEIALGAAKRTGLPVVVSLVFDSGRDHDRTMMGTTVEQAAEQLARAGADVVGANCGVGIEPYVAICGRLARAAGLPVWIKPNAGLPQLSDGTITYSTSPEDFALQALRLRDAGASFIGGCCGTTPAFIRAVRAALEAPAMRP